MADNGTGSVLDGLTEDELAQLLGLSVNSQKMGLQGKQLDMANALRNQRYEGGGAGVGGAMGALGSGLANAAGAMKAREAMGAQDQLMQQRQAGLGLFAKKYFQGKGNNAAGSGYSPAAGADGFGLGQEEI